MIRLLLAVLLLAGAMAGPIDQARAQTGGAMIFGADAASSPDAVSLPTSNDYFFTQGNGVNIPATSVPSYWANKVGAEIGNAITLSGQTLSMPTYNQLWQAMENAASAAAAVVTQKTSDLITINLTGVSSPDALTSTQLGYGVLYFVNASAAMTINLGSGTTAQYTVFNNTSYPLTFSNGGGGTVTVQTGLTDALFLAPGLGVFSQKTQGATASVGNTSQALATNAFATNSVNALLTGPNTWPATQTFSSSPVIPNATGNNQPIALGQFTSGSTSNGQYLRFPNGTLMQWGTVAGPSAANGSASYTWPTPFAGYSSITLTPQNAAGTPAASSWIVSASLGSFSFSTNLGGISTSYVAFGN